MIQLDISGKNFRTQQFGWLTSSSISLPPDASGWVSRLQKGIGSPNWLACLITTIFILRFKNGSARLPTSRKVHMWADAARLTRVPSLQLDGYPWLPYPLRSIAVQEAPFRSISTPFSVKRVVGATLMLYPIHIELVPRQRSTPKIWGVRYSQHTMEFSLLISEFVIFSLI